MRKKTQILSMSSLIYFKKINVSILIIMGMCFFSACSSQRVWTYAPETKIMSDPIRNNSVAVPPFIDKRINENKDKVALSFIPLFPFGWQTMYTPEGTRMHIISGLWLFRPNEDFAKAVAIELENASIFKEVFFTNRPSEADLSLIGTIESTTYSGKMYTYCISFFGAYLWMIGFPAATISNDLVLNLKLQDNRTKEILKFP